MIHYEVSLIERHLGGHELERLSIIKRFHHSKSFINHTIRLQWDTSQCYVTGIHKHTVLAGLGDSSLAKHSCERYNSIIKWREEEPHFFVALDCPLTTFSPI